MKRLVGFVLMCFVLGATVVAQTAKPAPQFGLNFIGFFVNDDVQAARRGVLDTTTPHRQPEWILSDFAALGAQVMRQLTTADLTWDNLEPRPNQWKFTAADAVLLRADLPVTPIVTLFALQYASPTPPWEQRPEAFQRTLGDDARRYLETVIARYGHVVTYWELGNEMDHWRAADPNSGRPQGAPAERLPIAPIGGYSPKEQGAFLREAAAFIRQRDPDAVIVLPGMSGLDDDILNTWFAGVIEGGGTDWFDVVNYHHYSSWESFDRQRESLNAFLARHGIADKPVWLTETGVTRDATLTQRTNYPNSAQTQAADVFRRSLLAYGYGDSLVLWHTFVDSPNVPANAWRGYGVRQFDSTPSLAYHSYKLFAQELIPFARVEALNVDPRGVNAYRITTANGATKYVVWGGGGYVVPSGVSQYARVVANTSGAFAWQTAQAGERLALSPVPLLLK